MGGQAAEQIIAGVVLSERLAVTMYGAIHRAQWAGQRNLRGLVIDPKLLAEETFRGALVDTKAIATVTALEHKAIVPTVAVESGGPDVVIVTRGVGRYVTVQDLIAAARANRKEGGRLSMPVVGAIGKAVVEALAVAHQAKIVHGAVHPRSVLVDEDGVVRLGDFIVGCALTTAVAQGADSSLWRGLAGYLAPELALGEDPSPASDVFAVGAMLFTMLTGEVPPGALRTTPAIERLVHRALDTDLTRRYKNATDLLENLLEAFEDDRWELAERGDIIKAAGLSGTDTNIDDATEDLLASLGSSKKDVQVTPIRPSMDLRAEAVAARHSKTPTGSNNRLDALLADLDDRQELTSVDDKPFRRDPISELIQMDPRKREAIVQVKPRVPSLDDPDDETPIPPPERDSEADVISTSALRRSPGGRSSSPTVPHRSSSHDERAALDALSGLDPRDAPVRLSSAAEAAENAAAKLEQAAKRAEAAVARVGSSSEATAAVPPSRPRPVVAPIVDPIDLEMPPVRIKSRARGIVGMLVVAAVIGGVVYMIVKTQSEVADNEAAGKQKEQEERERKEREAKEKQRQLTEAQADAGTLVIKSNPTQGGAWLKLGRTPVTTPFELPSAPMGAPSLEIRVELDGYQPVDTQITNAHWSGDKAARTAKITVPLRQLGKDAKGKPEVVTLPPTPPKPPDPPPGDPSRGKVTIESTPKNAEVWLYIGVTDQVRFDQLIAGRAYEVRVLKDGFLPGFAAVSPDDWRDPSDDPKKPIDLAKKKSLIEMMVELVPDPSAKKGK